MTDLWIHIRRYELLSFVVTVESNLVLCENGTAPKYLARTCQRYDDIG